MGTVIIEFADMEFLDSEILAFLESLEKEFGSLDFRGFRF